MRRRYRRPALLLAACAVLAGCGSTVSGIGTQAAGTNADGSLTSTSGSVTPNEVNASTSATSASPQATTPTARDGTPTDLGAPGGTTSTTGTPTVDHSPISVGLFVQADSSALANSFGVSNLQNGNEPALAKAVVDQVNATGGVNGRLLAPIFFVYDPSKQSDIVLAQQQACTMFTQDHHVVAVMLGWHGYTDHTLETCLVHKSVIVINSAGIETGDAQDVARLTSYFSPPGLTLDREAVAYVDGLWDEGFFTAKARLGLISIDDGAFHRAANGALTAALKRHGLTLTDASYYPPVVSTSDASRQSAAVANAVLRFKTDRVTHVLFLQQGINGPFYFMRAADSQNYLPQYGLSTTDAPTALAPLVPVRQLANSRGIGWLPVFDVTASKEDRSAPLRSACLRNLQKRTGETFQNRTVEYVGESFCDSAAFFTYAASRNPGPINSATFAAAVANLNDTYRSPMVLNSSFESHRRDGVISYRNLRYDAACTCFVYQGTPHLIS